MLSTASPLPLASLNASLEAGVLTHGQPRFTDKALAELAAREGDAAA
jgi:hypothetical protein